MVLGWRLGVGYDLNERKDQTERRKRVANPTVKKEIGIDDLKEFWGVLDALRRLE